MKKGTINFYGLLLYIGGIIIGIALGLLLAVYNKLSFSNPFLIIIVVILTFISSIIFTISTIIFQNKINKLIESHK